MPKAIRRAEEVESVKLNILKTALKLMCDEGFDALSMRKLAARLKMTAANIYNYYKNKDDLYLAIQTQGFRMIVDRFQDIYDSDQPSKEKLYNMMHAYFKFGIEYPDYYEIMFSRNTPKYADYKGTPMEPMAFIEKQTALKVSEITTRTLMDLYDGNDAIEENDALYRTIVVWSTLHGVVNLFNSRVLQEVEDASEELIYKLFNDLMKIAIKPKAGEPA
jgi:AcrR family transcriptional regulator